MHMASLKKNFLYNISITLANYIAALIVFPYVSRCLGVELMGKQVLRQMWLHISVSLHCWGQQL